ncbi:MAG: hypothetical protein BWY91_03128 [bacterium ADurb.BinA028]|nr:MAG: hypothetical protein BWY91_03128 [bacterium ADurb.BinA028]
MAVRAAATSVIARYGAGDCLPVLRSASIVDAAMAPVQVASSRGISGRVTVTAPETTFAAQSMDASRNSAGANIASATPNSNAAGPLSIRLVLSAFSTIIVSALAGPTRLGNR